ncbi:MAG: lipocalin family protein [Legionellales bacterium]
MHYDIKKKSNLGILSLALATFALALQVKAADNEPKTPPVTPVQKIDINHYVGKWYEIARFPMYFQRHCASDVIATYGVDKADSSKIIVDNQCRKSDGTVIQSIGQATPVDASNSKLQVTFLPKFLRWLPVGRAPYWILKIDADYQTALVGNPEHKYLWILSRTPQISETTYQSYMDEARRQGFDVSKLKRTTQTINVH